MTIKHATTKAAGQKLHAVADWNANHIINEIEMTDDKKIWFDTAKSYSLFYSSNHGDIVWGSTNLVAIAGFGIYTNTAADGGGNWEPEFSIGTDGIVQFRNTSQGAAGSKYVWIRCTDGLKIRTAAQNVHLKATNLTAERLLEFPNAAGTFIATGNTEDIMVATPATAGAAGVAGQISYDASFFYVCVASNSWKRVAIAAW